MTLVHKENGIYHGVQKGNGNLASGYHGAHFEDNKEIPKLIKRIINKIMKDEFIFTSDYFQITGVHIDYDLQMVDVKYVW